MLLDTSGLLCYFDQDELRHATTREFFDAASRKLTHSYVLAEFVALAQARKLPRPAALDYVTDIAIHPDIKVMWVDQTIHDAAVAFLKARLDKTYSLCDAVSFIVMRNHGLREALTTDVHFEQEGFARLLK